VAVIDSGLDTGHPDLPQDALWRNPAEVPGNGLDDDRNGYLDDVWGWDFSGNTGDVRDVDGHGTFVAGLIAAKRGNGEGIAGINPHARIMVLRALNRHGEARASHLAEALAYAADHGARIANISAGGTPLTRTEARAVAYAHGKGMLVVAAAGNDGAEVGAYAPAGLDHVLTVAATGPDDERAAFSNWGAAIDVAAPGVDVLSLRARHTDLMLGSLGTDYEPGSAVVGEGRRYYHASGTSFSAPLVAGVASLLWSGDPSLSPAQVRRMILQSARNIDAPGPDQFSGYGLLDARAALEADPEFFIETRIQGVRVVQAAGAPVVRVIGTATANAFGRAWLELGEGGEPTAWKRVAATIREPVTNGPLRDVPARAFTGAKEWTLRLIVEHADGRRREAWFALNLG
jgi:subtilisin family serine protease